MANHHQAAQSLAKNGRSFYWASRFLGKHTAGAAAELYAFCRILDDLADGDLPDGPARLSQIKADLMNGGMPSDPAHQIFYPMMTAYAIPTQGLLDLLEGLLMDQQPVKLKDETALVRYAYHVAGAVGLLMCPVLKCHDDIAAAHAIDMGIAMQLTNIARDVKEDAAMGRVYLPASWINGMTADDILAAATSPASKEYQQITAAIKRLLDLADQYYESGNNGLRYLPIRAHLAIGVAGRVYRQIGVQLAASGVQWGDGRTVTSTAAKLKASIAALKLMASRYRKSAPHQASLHHPLKGYVL